VTPAQYAGNIYHNTATWPYLLCKAQAGCRAGAGVCCGENVRTRLIENY